MYIPLRVVGICNVDMQSIFAMAVSYESSPNISTDMGPTIYHLCWTHTVKQMPNLQYIGHVLILSQNMWRGVRRMEYQSRSI